jgi:acetyltransferase
VSRSPHADAVPGRITLPNGREVLVRPARPADAPLVQAFVRGLSDLSRRRRFFGPVAELSPAQLDRLTRVRDPRELALVAIDPTPGGLRVVAMAQYALDESGEAEFALVVDDGWQRSGLGTRLLAALAARAAARGVRALHGEVLAENWPMLGLLAAAGFELTEDADPEFVRARKALAPARTGPLAGWLAAAWQSSTRSLEVATAY